VPPCADTAWAMSEENVDALRAAFGMYARGDFSPIGMLGDEFELVISPEAPDAGTYRGEEARRWLRAWVASFEGMTIEATEILDAGDKVFLGMTQRGRPPGSAVSVEGRWWQVSTFRGREIVRVEMFPDRAQALEAAGLRE
jgi:ketosteroid isomerase-like protein